MPRARGPLKGPKEQTLVVVSLLHPASVAQASWEQVLNPRRDVPSEHR